MSNQSSARTWRNFFLRPENKAADLFLRLARRTAVSIPQAHGFAQRLEQLAEVVSELPDIAGAMVVGCEDGFPLAYGSSNISLRQDIPPFTSLENICKIVPKWNIWSAVPPDQIANPDINYLCARRVVDNGITLGMVLVSLHADRKSPPVLEGINKGLEHFKWVIRDAMQLEEMHLIKKLRELELEELGRTKPIEPQAVANRLKEIFRADAATILVREQDKLYLSATTDPSLSSRVFSYEPREGLAGYIFSSGKPFRLRNGHDREEARLNSEGEYTREAPRHPESISTTGIPFRYLAVPMLSGGEVRGVIRILRRETAEPFSSAEQRTLEHFANLLGLSIHTAWRLLLANHIMKAETEAICISRSEPDKKHFLPRLVDANPGAERLFNLNRDQIVGRDTTELYYPGEYNKIRMALERTVAECKQICGPIKTTVNRFRDPGNDSRSVEISYRILTSPFVRPDTHYTIAIIRDTTDSQIKADQHNRLMTLLAKKGLAYFRADKYGRVVESSPAESKLTGYSNMLGMSREDLYYDPGDRQELLLEAGEKDGQLFYTTQLLKRKDGTPFWAQGVIHLLKDADGHNAGHEGLYEDVTERFRLQGFLDLDTKEVLKEQELYRILEENVGFQLLFMRSVGHQLRSPLGALVEQLVNFQEGISDPERFGQRLKYVVGQARVCALLVANLTYMDKVLRGESFKFKRVNLTKLAIETKLDFEHLSLEKGIKMDVNDKSLDKHLSVWGHPELLRQIFVNLIDNAIKYSMPNSHIKICGRHDELGRYLQITNRGLRIARQDRDAIFERGFRTREAEALVPAGTGLGLWLVRKICSAHEATIRCTEILEDGEERTAVQIFFKPHEMRRSAGRRRFT